MRRALRHLFTILSALSLLLAVAIVVLWVRSYWLTDQVVWQRVHNARWVRSATGEIVVELNSDDWSGYRADFYGLKYARGEPIGALASLVMTGLRQHMGDTTDFWERGGFGWSELRRPNGRVCATAVAPFWSVALAAGVLPLGWTVTRLRARRRKRVGLCPTCGYDLRASPERCPECGLLTSGAPTAGAAKPRAV